MYFSLFLSITFALPSLEDRAIGVLVPQASPDYTEIWRIDNLSELSAQRACEYLYSKWHLSLGTEVTLVVATKAVKYNTSTSKSAIMFYCKDRRRVVPSAEDVMQGPWLIVCPADQFRFLFYFTDYLGDGLKHRQGKCTPNLHVDISRTMIADEAEWAVIIPSTWSSTSQGVITPGHSSLMSYLRVESATSRRF